MGLPSIPKRGSLLMNVLCVPVGPLQANCYLISDTSGRACAVDPGGEPERLATIAQERGLTLSHVLLTHGHFDHLAGSVELSRLTGALIGCAPEVAPMLREPDRYIPFPGYQGVPGKEPDLLLEDGAVLPVGDLTVRVVATPGHSPGDTTYEIEGSLFCGDLLFFRSVGRTDLPGGDFDVLRASVQKLMDRYPPETKVYPGHMQPTTLGEEAASNPFLGG
jgi:glyoxylase-like metal-dependent hydrolase (beta-lactamase superfamily II)